VRAPHRRIIALLAALCCVLGTLQVVSARQAHAAAAADFNAGNVISDTVFYNAGAMSAGQIQTFLNSKVPSCASGYTCLKSYRETTKSRAADARCAAYPGSSNETAATIIAKVAKACSINPQVILVTLEKEESLVSATSPTSGRYRIAMGYGCPDSSGCDATYYGFFNQVYSAAHQYQVYRAYPTSFNFVAGKSVKILYSPSTSCGTKTVTIANQATAGLYDYTPYTPNAAALKNLYGTGDSCSAYGIRNFWVLFTDWFGSTQSYPVAPQLTTLWNQTGGSSGALGYPTQTVVKYPDGGVGQGFDKGWAYWSATHGAFMTSGQIGRSFVTLIGPKGVLGYPTAAQESEPGGTLSQAFQNGSLYTTPAGKIHRVATTILTKYLALGGPGGTMGYPADSTNDGPAGGLVEPFDNGRIYWSADTNAVNVPTAALAAYDGAGGPAGKLGYPIQAAAVSADGSSSVQFENGSITWSASKVAVVTMRPDPAVKRVSGADRYGTAIAVSKASFPDTAPVVYIATGQQYPDALSAAPAAAEQGGPLLLTLTASLPVSVSNEIKRLKPSKIVVVGGSGAVSVAVLTALKKLAPSVVRVSGDDRFATSKSVVQYAFGTVPNLYVATGMDYPDALSASAAAASQGSAVLLVDGRKASLPATTSSFIASRAPKQVYVLGGTSVVSSGIQSAVSKIVSTARLFGSDRYATNQAVARIAAPTAADAVLATGSDYPDALAGATLSGRNKAPLYLVQKACIPARAWVGINIAGVRSLTVLGGSGVVASGVTSLKRCD